MNKNYPDNSETYVLYGSYASYYTAKVRAYLRKKGIPFVERLPSEARFRSTVRPASGSHRIPQLLAPDGTVVQDSVAIYDYLEDRFPAVPGLPPTTCQRLATHLFELFGGEGLLRLAWQFRWYHPEMNDRFVRMDFGRSFKPQGTDAELLHYGSVIADRMLSLGTLDTGPEVRAAMEAEFKALLALMERHLQSEPFLLGGHPSNADYSIMGALHAHMGRDPWPLSVMQANAPRVFRWVEHMMTPEIVSPEFHDREIAWPANDELPETTVALLQYLIDQYGEQYRLGVLAFNQHVKEVAAVSGQPVSEGNDQPTLPEQQVTVEGNTHTVRASVYPLWLLQRSLTHYHGANTVARGAMDQLLDRIGGRALLANPLTAPLTRINNLMAYA